MKRIAVIIVGVLGFSFAAGGTAFAHHDDPTPETNAQRCDTWYRPGHQPNTNQPNSHSHKYPDNDQEVGPVYVHNHGGHYVVAAPPGYVEVIGGQGYNRNGNQGGAVQGEVDPGGPATGNDVDFNVNTFAGAEEPYAEAAACLSVNNNKVGDQGQQPNMAVPSLETADVADGISAGSVARASALPEVSQSGVVSEAVIPDALLAAGARANTSHAAVPWWMLPALVLVVAGLRRWRMAEE